MLASQRSERYRNAPKISRSLWQSVTELLEEKQSLEQISAQLEVSHETIYEHVYVNRSLGESYIDVRRSVGNAKRAVEAEEAKSLVAGLFLSAQPMSILDLISVIGRAIR